MTRIMKHQLWLLLDATFLIVFNLVFFIAGGTQQPGGVWAGYWFIHFSYLMMLLTPRFVRQGSRRAALFGMTLETISAIYFGVAFICGLVFIFRYPQDTILSLISQIIIAGIYIVILISNVLANEQTIEALDHHANELQFIKQASGRLQAVLNQTTDQVLQKKIEQAYDLAHASQVHSTSQVRQTELDVMSRIDLLEKAATSHNTTMMNSLLDQIITGIETRNRQLKFGQ